MSDKRSELEIIATEIVQIQGLSNLSFRTLAEKAGVKSSSVHYYFPEKSDLALVIIEKYTENFLRYLDSISNSKKTFKEKVTTFAKTFEEVLKDDKLCLCAMLSAEIDSLDEKSRQALRYFFQVTETWLVNLLSENYDDVISPLSTKTLARIIVSGLEGAMLLDRVDNKKGYLKAQQELLISWVK